MKQQIIKLSCWFLFLLFFLFPLPVSAAGNCDPTKISNQDLKTVLGQLKINVNFREINVDTDTVYYDSNNSYFTNNQQDLLCETTAAQTGQTKQCKNISNYTWKITINKDLFSSLPSDCKVKLQINLGNVGVGTVTKELGTVASLRSQDQEINITSDNKLGEAVYLFLPFSNQNKSTDFIISLFVGNTLSNLLNLGNDGKELKTTKYITMKPRSPNKVCQISFLGLSQQCRGTSIDPSGGNCTEGATVDDNVSVKVTNLDTDLAGEFSLWKDTQELLPKRNNGVAVQKLTEGSTVNLGTLTATSGGKPYTFVVKLKDVNNNEQVLCDATLPVVKAGEDLLSPEGNQSGTTSATLQIANTIPLCASIPDSAKCGSNSCRSLCEKCAGSDNNKIWTGIGCLPTNVEELTKNLFNVFSGTIGAFLVFCFVSNGIKVMTAQGKPETIKKATEAITSCIIGLLVLIFSFLILRIIGVDLLQIPGLSK